MKKKIEKLVIDRKKWGRTATGGNLLNNEGKMCCLGFQCRAVGFKPKEIRGKGMPADVDVSAKRLQKVAWLVDGSEGNSTVVAEKLALINDDWDTTDKQKEKAITKLFANNGIEVTFIN